MRLIVLVLVSLLSASAWAQERHLATPPLSQTARALVHRKMENHSKEMTELVWSVVLLDYARTMQLAQAIAIEPRFARPTDSDATDLNAALSPEFFVFQDQLRERAKKLAERASLRDAKAVARGFGAVTETCVGCHDTFLNAR